MAWGVDQVEAIGEAIVRHVVQAHRAGLDGDPLLALQIHGVEHLRGHQPGLDRVGRLEQAVGQGRLPMVDVRDDAEVAQPRLRDGAHGLRIARSRQPRRRALGAERGGASATIARRLNRAPEADGVTNGKDPTYVQGCTNTAVAQRGSRLCPPQRGAAAKANCRQEPRREGARDHHWPDPG